MTPLAAVEDGEAALGRAGRAPSGRESGTRSRPPFLLLTGHDYRSRRRANLHFIADELKTFGPTRFFSVGFSLLSSLAGDPRLDLRSRANRVEVVDGVECYLWSTLLHPFNPKRAWLDRAAAAGFGLYARRRPALLDGWIRDSGTIIVESGLPVVLFKAAKRLNPDATMIYLASDDLATIGCAPHLSEILARTAARYDHVVLPSRALRHGLPTAASACYVPHGIDPAAFAQIGPSPFTAARNAVSVGSMLFDAQAVAAAAAAFPDVAFHVIGAGPAAAALSGANIHVLGEMPFADTLPYIAHADIGMAPYDGARVGPYLADTSMKLMQYAYLGLPAVCPASVVGRVRGRFGYDPADPASIREAIAAAMAHGRFAGSPMLTWREVTDRILQPGRFADTGIACQADIRSVP